MPGASSKRHQKIHSEWDAMNYCSCKLGVRGARLTGQSLHRKVRDGQRLKHQSDPDLQCPLTWASCYRGSKCPHCSSQWQLSVSSAENPNSSDLGHYSGAILNESAFVPLFQHIRVWEYGSGSFQEDVKHSKMARQFIFEPTLDNFCDSFSVTLLSLQI